MMRAVVTGATNGIGEAIARRLAGEGLTVTLVGRSDDRLQAARERIAAAVPGADLAVERADLSELTEVRELACRLLAGPTPDAVISNAALVTPLDRRTSDGIPRVLAVNHLAPYLLLRTLAAGLGRARLVVVAADPVSLGRRPVDLDDLTFDHPERLGEPAELRPFFAYGRTKTMNAMFVYALARRLAGTRITVNACHPGVIAGTGLSSEVPGLAALVREAFRSGRLRPPGPQPGGHGPARFAESGEGPGADEGADTPAWLATSPAMDGVTSSFFVDRSPVETAPHMTDTERCERLWNDSARLVGLPL
jgi:NAD(P)-dependent dehydrogenase (short-subunit alcohol dehydrogenase family)